MPGTGSAVISGVDDSEVLALFKKMEKSSNDMLAIEMGPALAIINDARMRVPTDTTATKNSISQHITKATKTRVEDEVGPETHYSPSIEFGIPSQPNYPIQSFLRPASLGNIPGIIKATTASIRLWLKNQGINF
jgi:hypothetical protein